MGGLLPLRLLSQRESSPTRRSKLSYSSSVKKSTSTLPPSTPADKGVRQTVVKIPTMTQDNKPKDEKEWRMVLDIARDLYLAGQYEDCFLYCINVLECARGLIHPLHVIYLSFYAATTSELTARSQRHTSDRKMYLLGQARSYYQKSLFYVPQASFEKKLAFQGQDIEEEVSSRTQSRCHSVASTYEASDLNTDGSSRSSSGSSVFSISSSMKRAPVSSPTPSFCSDFTTEPTLNPPRLGKKKPGFQPTLPALLSESNLRSYTAPPDLPSPTTTLDSARLSVQARISSLNKSSAHCAALLTKSFPSAVTKTRSVSASSFLGVPARNLRSPLPESIPAGQSISLFLKQRHISRYQEQLLSLEPRIRRHMSAVSDLITSLQQESTSVSKLATRDTEKVLLSPSPCQSRSDSKMSMYSSEQKVLIPQVSAPGMARHSSHGSPLFNSPQSAHGNLYDDVLESRGDEFCEDSLPNVIEDSWMDESYDSGRSGFRSGGCLSPEGTFGKQEVAMPRSHASSPMEHEKQKLETTVDEG